MLRVLLAVPASAELPAGLILAVSRHTTARADNAAAGTLQCRGTLAHLSRGLMTSIDRRPAPAALCGTSLEAEVSTGRMIHGGLSSSAQRSHEEL